MRWWNRIFRSMPDSAAVSRMYWRIEAPSPMACDPVQGRNGYPSVYMSESERMPG